MLGALGVVESEYENPTDLMGLGEMDTELLGYLNALNPIARAKAMSKLVKKPIPSKGSRAEFEKFFAELPKHIKEQLLQGKLRLADHLIYSIKPVNNAKTIKMFESQDVKEVNLRNISNGKLPKNMALLVSGIYLLQGQAASLSVEDIKITAFSSIENVGALANGEFKLKANKKQLVSDISNRKFVTTGFDMVPRGYYKLANPRLIHDDIDIEFEIELGTVSGINANTVIYVGLEGTATIP
jgi:methyltransferase-like protein